MRVQSHSRQPYRSFFTSARIKQLDTFLTAQYRSPHMGVADEIVAIVDEHNTVLGSAPRREMRAKALPHRATYVLVFNSQDQLYVQKRTLTKDVFPGYYDPAAGGVVLAGEDYPQGALREVEEEMGVRGVPLTALFEFYHKDAHNRVWGAAFSCVYDGEIVLQEEEVESGFFMATAEILQLAETEPFTPDGLYVLKRYIAENHPESKQDEVEQE